ncbi:MAG: electron transport complex protein RnfC [Chloroflexi bacterium]|nr:electron transport complex protein RnfC [Chloroflexota bacterium]
MVEEIVQKVKDAGVVGAGGAGFPTHVKIAAQVDTVIANGAECDPLLRCDQQLMANRAPEVIEGLRLVMQASGAERGVIALKREYTSAVAALQSNIQYPIPNTQRPPQSPQSWGEGGHVSLHLLESHYPAGDEFVLVYEVTGRLVPETGLPLHVGCIVQNVGTLFNIARAQRGIPVTHRLLTVTGAVHEPKTLNLPIGTSIGEAVAWAGGIKIPRWTTRTEEDYAVVVGGPMMGRLAQDLSDPITKTTTGLIVLPRDNVVVRYLGRPLGSWVKRGRSTCDQCRDCTDLCPRYLLGHDLEPHKVMRSINYGLTEPTAIMTAAVLCCECRLCEAYACPLELSPMAYYREIKRQLAAPPSSPPTLGGKEGGQWKNVVHKRSDLMPHAMREYRRVPMERLVARLGLSEYQECTCPLDEREYQPRRVTIPLKQHTGVPAQPVIKVGDRVQRGDLIAQIPEGKLGANVHASISGKVEAVTGEDVVIGT